MAYRGQRLPWNCWAVRTAMAGLRGNGAGWTNPGRSPTDFLTGRSRVRPVASGVGNFLDQVNQVTFFPELEGKIMRRPRGVGGAAENRP